MLEYLLVHSLLLAAVAWMVYSMSSGRHDDKPDRRQGLAVTAALVLLVLSSATAGVVLVLLGQWSWLGAALMPLLAACWLLLSRIKRRHLCA